MQVGLEGRLDQKARTRRDLLATGVRLVAEGGRPTLEEVAEAAGISRRTAYRYFRSQEHLLADIALESLRPGIAQLVETAGKPNDAEDRVLTLMSALHAANQKYEPQLRTILAASLSDEQADSTSEPGRGGRRVDWIRQAVAPLHDEISPSTQEMLISALTIVAGYDAFRMLRQMRDLPPDEIESVIRWMASALIRAARKDFST
jgi:AcrR family transcriptional regulator